MASFRTPAGISFKGFFSRLFQIRQLVVIGRVKEASQNNGIICCCLGLSLVDVVMKILNLRTATTEKFLNAFL